MYSHFDVFDVPEDDVWLWRYMDLVKFVSLLEHGALYFSRADRFSDPFECVYPRPVMEWLASMYAETLGASGNASMSMMLTRRMRETFLLNCWHENAFESAAMWDLYDRTGNGVAVRTTMARLKRSFARTEEIVYIGRVRYIDYEREVWTSQEMNTLYPTVHKRKSFEHEREVRAVIWNMSKLPMKHGMRDGKPFGHLDFDANPISHGVLVQVQLADLVEQVYVAPNSQLWMHDLIRRLCNRYGLEVEVTRSNLYEAPLY